jgi:hypothetical protein
MRTVALALTGLIVVTAVAARRPIGAQFGRQRVSPHEDVRAAIDGARLTITYGRPSMRGRVIFGSLVPYGDVWCPGADEATTLDSTRALQIGRLRVPRGPHTIWVLPEKDPAQWKLVVSKEESGFHNRYYRSQDLGRVDATVRPLASPVEQLTFALKANPAGGGTIVMTWAQTEMSVPFAVVQ